MEHLEGRYFEAGGARASPAELELKDCVFQICVDGSDRNITWGRARNDVSASVPGIPTRFTFPDGSMFEVPDGPITKAFLQEHRFRRGFGLYIEEKRSLFISILVLMLFVPVLVWVSFASTMDAIARALPDSFSQTVGDATYQQIELFMGLDPSTLDSEKQAELQRVFRDVVATSDASLDEVRLELRQSDILSANALALPNGTIIMSDALVQLAESSDELAAVMAHEIVHVTEDHGMRALVRSLGVAFLISFIIGDAGSSVEAIASAGGGLLTLSYSRDFEIEADEGAAEIMRRMGLEPVVLVNLLRRMQAHCGEACEKTWLGSTHPGLRDRLEAVSRNPEN